MTRTIRCLIIHGRVQGVGYRAWMREAAQGRGLEGWVRNRRDGTVEAVIAGPADEVAAMIADCRRGPSFAQVTRIDDRDASADELNLRNGAKGFVSLPTL